MSDPTRLRPLKEAARITQMLDVVLGADRFDRMPVDVIGLALEYSRQIAPDSPIHEVVERNIPGCVGALVYGRRCRANGRYCTMSVSLTAVARLPWHTSSHTTFYIAN